MNKYLMAANGAIGLVLANSASPIGQLLGMLNLFMFFVELLSREES